MTEVHWPYRWRLLKRIINSKKTRTKINPNNHEELTCILLDKVMQGKLSKSRRK